jgi:hypothetical protein
VFPRWRGDGLYAATREWADPAEMDALAERLGAEISSAEGG